MTPTELTPQTGSARPMNKLTLAMTGRGSHCLGIAGAKARPNSGETKRLNAKMVPTVRGGVKWNKLPTKIKECLSLRSLKVVNWILGKQTCEHFFFSVYAPLYCKFLMFVALVCVSCGH